MVGMIDVVGVKDLGRPLVRVVGGGPDGLVGVLREVALGRVPLPGGG